MSDIVTTEWKSAFAYDNVYQGYHEGNLFQANCSDYMVLKYQDDYYAISNPDITFSDTGFTMVNGGSSIKYDSSSMLWGSEDTFSQLPSSAWTNGEVLFSSVEILSQNIDSSKTNYYTTSQFRSGNVFAPTGNRFDAIYTSNIFSGVLAVLPVVLVVLVGFLAVRKGISFISGKLKGV